jgi:hypothetical protein
VEEYQEKAQAVMRTYTDSQLLDPRFPDPRLDPQTRQEQLREWERGNCRDMVRRKTVIERVNEWIHLFHADAVDAEVKEG